MEPTTFTVLSIGPDEDGHVAAAFALAAEHNPSLRLMRAAGLDASDTLHEHADLLVISGHGAASAQSIALAQAHGLPAVAFADNDAAQLIENGRSGVLVPPTTVALAQAIHSLSHRAALRERLAIGGLRAAGARPQAPLATAA